MPAQRTTLSPGHVAGLRRDEALQERAPLSRAPPLATGEHSVARRLVLTELVAEGWARIAGCDLPRLMERAGLRVLTGTAKSSASESMVLLGELRADFVPVAPPPNATPAERRRIAESNGYQRELLDTTARGAVAKLTYAPLNPRLDNSLAVERLLYDRVVLRLAEFGATPHVMLPVATYRCRGFRRTLASWPPGDPVRRGIERGTADIRGAGGADADYDWDELRVLLLERGRGSPLGDWARGARRTLDEWRSVLWQVLYTLVCFEDVGLRHNDLHTGNVWVDTDLAPQTFVYFVDRRTYYAVPLVRGTLVRLYDFDQATAPAAELRGAPGAPRNTKLDDPYFCRNTGICNGRNRKFDAFIVLSSLWNELREDVPPAVLDAVLRWFRGSKRLLAQRWGFPHRPCRLVAPGMCDGDYEPPDALMAPVEEMLRDELFRGWRRELPAFDPAFLPEADFPNLFMLPRLSRSTAAARSIEDALERDRIEPVRFPLPRPL